MGPVIAEGCLWHAIQARSNRERAVRDFLSRAEIVNFWPAYEVQSQWSDRQKIIQRPLFPGYLFARIGAVARPEVLKTPGVLRILETPVSQQEIDCVNRLLSSDMPVTPTPYITAGELVRVEHGKLAGLEGIVMRTKGNLRVVVSLHLLRRSVAVELDTDCVKPVVKAHSGMIGSPLRMAA